MNNDTRETLPANGSFHNLVLTLFQQQLHAALLYEDGGITRANGLVTVVFERDGRHWMRLGDQLEIAVDTLYAINGIFSSDFSTC